MKNRLLSVLALSLVAGCGGAPSDARPRIPARAKTGAICGLVIGADAEGQPQPVAAASLSFLPSGTEDPEMAVATASSDEDGAFASLDLPPGTYEVVASKGAVHARQGACLVSAGGRAFVELHLP